VNCFGHSGPLAALGAEQITPTPIRHNHPFGYVNGNPISFFDPLGLDTCSCLAPQTGVRENMNKVCTYNCDCVKASGERYTKTIRACEGGSGSATCKGQWEDPWSPNPNARTGFNPFTIDTDGWWDNIFNKKYIKELQK